ncbi:MAG TPA: nucleotidyltransferase family protein [Candidatus Acidoferrum sp.]|nr:nucleotidyltransferase family protein [Candidatus Acidoferrum sp.]
MKAMILAAGLGTRLRPLTDSRPKALVEVAGRTLLEITLTRLSSFGVRDVIINVHHFPDMILDYLKAHDNFGLHIEISREEQLLDTGGGLKKASWFFLQDSAHAEEPFILHNVDVISTIDLRRMLEFHNEKQALATLAVQHRQSSRQLLFDSELRLCGRRVSLDQEPELVRGNFTTTLPEGMHKEGTASAVPKNVSNAGASAPEVPPQPFAFTGIHIISPRLFRLMEELGAFSIIDTYLQLSARGEKILAYPADDAYWRDLGKPADLAQAAKDILQVSRSLRDPRPLER